MSRLAKLWAGLRRPEGWIGAGLGLAEPLTSAAKWAYRSLDAVSNIDFIWGAWPLIVGFLGSNYWTALSLLGGGGLIAHSVYRADKPTTAQAAMPPVSNPNPSAPQTQLASEPYGGRDASVLDALYYVAFGSWRRKPWGEMGGLTGELTRAGNEIRQKARDGELPMWGASPGSEIQNPIDPDYWAYFGIDFPSIIRGKPEVVGTELKESGVKVNAGKLVWLMTNKSTVERLWPVNAAVAALSQTDSASPKPHKLYTAGDKERLGEAFYEISNLLMVDGMELKQRLHDIEGAFRKATRPFTENKTEADLSAAFEVVDNAQTRCNKLIDALNGPNGVRKKYQAYQDDILEIVEDEYPGVLKETLEAIRTFRQNFVALDAVAKLKNPIATAHVWQICERGLKPIRDRSNPLDKFLIDRNLRIEAKRKLLA